MDLRRRVRDLVPALQRTGRRHETGLRPPLEVELLAEDGLSYGLGRDAAPALDRALLTGAGLLASEQLGIADWCLTTTVSDPKERHQFGRPVGSFQAVKHRLANLWLEVAGARAAARNAAEECIQLHGGLGMTWEHPAHLYLKRAKADQIALGTPGHHRATLANLPAP